MLAFIGAVTVGGFVMWVIIEVAKAAKRGWTPKPPNSPKPPTILH